jgi:hypothetical protein
VNVGNPGKGRLEINNNLSFPKSLVFFFMSLNHHVSIRRRGLSHEATPIIEIGMRKAILSTQESTLRTTLYDSVSSPFSALPITFKMASAGGSSGARGASSSQPSASSVIGNLYSHQFAIQSTTNHDKFINKYRIFQFEEDAMTTPWYISSPLNITLATHPLPKFKEHLPKFSGNNTVSTNKHLVEFSNACHNIRDNDNDTCMRLFINSLEEKEATDFFDLPPKILSTWEELVYWFKSTYGQSKSPNEQLWEYNNISYKYGETIKSFNLRFTKLYNQIPKLFRPKNQAAFMHYNNALPCPYHHRIKEKAIENLSSALHTSLEYEEKLERTSLPKGDSIKQTNMSSLIQLVQDMNIQMISYERKGNVPSLTHKEYSSSTTPFRNTKENNFHPKSIVSRSWCNFCEENHEESTCEVKKSARDKIFGKKPKTIIAFLAWEESKEVMIINTRKSFYAPKGKYNPPHTYSTPT